ncbi:MAG: hypothetical protein R6X09_01425 [Bacteroidales bacterium]
MREIYVKGLRFAPIEYMLLVSGYQILDLPALPLRQAGAGPACRQAGVCVLGFGI